MNIRSGTEGYADEAPALFERYEGFSFADAHGSAVHLIPTKSSLVLDIGAGTGRDAAALAAMGHRVVAVEPTEAMRSRARVLHPEPSIEWVDDGLPELDVVRARKERFDLIMLTAVWMHLDQDQRREAMPNVASVLAAGGRVVMTLRHGPVPIGRRMFEVTAEETTALAGCEGLTCTLKEDIDSIRQAGINWTRLAFAAPLA